MAVREKYFWFKHPNNARNCHLIRMLRDSQEYEAVILLYDLLELFSQYSNNGKSVLISYDMLARETGWKPSKCQRLIAKISAVSQIDMGEKQCGKNVDTGEIRTRNGGFLLPNLLKFLEDAPLDIDIDIDTDTDIEKNTTTSAHAKAVTLVENKPVTSPPSTAEITEAYEVWNTTRGSFGLPVARITPVEENSIARAIKNLGFENVLLALEGARHEQKTDNFDPRNHLKLDRVLHRSSTGVSHWERFRDMALHKRSTSNIVDWRDDLSDVYEAIRQRGQG